MSKADDIRQAYAVPANRARIDQDSAGDRNRADRQVTKKVRALVAESARDLSELDELALEALAAKMASMVNLDPANNTALMRELLPAYVAQHIRER